MTKPLRTIEELGQISWEIWDRYWNQGGYEETMRQDPGTSPKEAELKAHTLIAKAIITALDDGVSWVPGDD